MVAMTSVFSALLKRRIVKNLPGLLPRGLRSSGRSSPGRRSHAASLTTDALRDLAARLRAALGLRRRGRGRRPREPPPTRSSRSSLIIAATGHPIHATWLFLPVSIVAGILFTAGVGLVIFTLASRFVDVQGDLRSSSSAAWFFLTPIVYTPDILAAKYRWIVRLNPMTYLVEMFRAPIYDGWLPGREHARSSRSSRRLGARRRLALLRVRSIEDYGTRH